MYSQLDSRPPRARACTTDVMDFVENVLAAHHRRDVAQAAIKSKLRGRRLLLESAATIGVGEAARRPRPVIAEPGSREKRLAGKGTGRTARRKVLLAAASAVSYEQLQQQHSLWRAYAAESLCATKTDDEAARLIGHMDWHGASVRVVKCACPSHLHAEGLLLAETRRMLLLLKEERRVWIPKVGTVIEIGLPTGLRVGESIQCDAATHI